MPETGKTLPRQDDELQPSWPYLKIGVWALLGSIVAGGVLIAMNLKMIYEPPETMESLGRHIGLLALLVFLGLASGIVADYALRARRQERTTAAWIQRIDEREEWTAEQLAGIGQQLATLGVDRVAQTARPASLAVERGPSSSQRLMPLGGQRSRGKRRRQKPAGPSDDNVTRLPSQETMRAARGLARRVIGSAGDNPGDNNSV